ncbi:hypothetical protein ABZ891_33030 [Streptomyces sp. NPDC047023]
MTHQVANAHTAVNTGRSLASLKTPSVKALTDAALSMGSLQRRKNFLP